MNARFAMGLALAAAVGGAFGQNDELEFQARLKADFHDKGIATSDRLDQDAIQAVCSLRRAEDWPQVLIRNLEQQQLAAVRYPADGKYMGDWKKGQVLAESGAGGTWSDQPGTPNGGNCYNCHQIAPGELSYGTMGPSLYHYGKIRGKSEDIQKYTYTKIFNSKSYNLCTAMPRFGHGGILSEEQIKDLVALLLDPESPVNSK
ncbi:MAG TPA: sulfur oxidation c-type cytochrome SoxX [Rhodocyclaceae bacterium]|nr:sulfur oxidation c-type cytochrome SoxX [Rhodocyclaceae bacterium]